MGRQKKKTEEEEGDWQEQVESLIDLGNSLDFVTTLRRQWREDPTTGESWKPTKRDAWIAENLKIRTKAGAGIPFELNAVQREYARVCREKQSKKNIVLKARQVGMTSYIAARCFVQTIARPGTLTMLVAHDREAAEEIFRIVHRFWDRLSPKWQRGALRTSHSSARELVFPRMDSEFAVTSADDNAGRGRTIQNLHCTEVSRWGKAGGEALASLRAAVVPNGEIVLESTANGAWGTFYEEWQQAEETGYTQHFFPWWFEGSYVADPGPAILLYTEEESALVKNPPHLTRGQIAWRRQQWATLRRMAAQEYAEDAVSCFRASGECAFEVEIIEKALEKAVEPLDKRDNGRISVWLPAQPGKKYVMGVDPAGGGAEGDYSCAEVIERETGMQCAELHGHFTQRELTKRIVELGEEYNSAMLAVERNNHGNGVLAHIENAKYEPIFEQKGLAGWNTTAQSKAAMIEKMADVLVESPELFVSSRLWNECRTFVRHKDGTTSAAPGTHDDCVMAMAIALAVRSVMAGKKKESS